MLDYDSEAMERNEGARKRDKAAEAQIHVHLLLPLLHLVGVASDLEAHASLLDSHDDDVRQLLLVGRGVDAPHDECEMIVKCLSRFVVPQIEQLGRPLLPNAEITFHLGSIFLSSLRAVGRSFASPFSVLAESALVE